MKMAKQSPISDTTNTNSITINGAPITIEEVPGVGVEDYINGVIHTQPEGSRIAVCGFKADPTSDKRGRWIAEEAIEYLPSCITPKNNTFLNTSTLYPGENGKFSAGKDSSAGLHFVMIDDLGVGAGSKVGFDGVMLPFSYMVETSPGNYQAGYILKEPITDKTLAGRLIDGVVDRTGGDKGAKNIVRWTRLPFGSNTKGKLVEEHGKPFRTRLVLWNPELLYTAEEIADAYELDLSAKTVQKKPQQRHTSETGSPACAEGKLDSLATWLAETGQLRVEL